MNKLNNAAVAAQKRHAEAIDEIFVHVNAVKGLMQAVTELIKAEQIRWRKEMLAAMPELDGLDFRVSDDGKHYELTSESKKQPDWVTTLLAELGNDDTPITTQ